MMESQGFTEEQTHLSIGEAMDHQRRLRALLARGTPEKVGLALAEWPPMEDLEEADAGVLCYNDRLAHTPLSCPLCLDQGPTVNATHPSIV